MKKMMLSLVILFAGVNAFAGSDYAGKTVNGDPCFVGLDLARNSVAFFAQVSDMGYGFGFDLTAQEIRTALEKGENMVSVGGSDGPLVASLTLNFNRKGNLDSAVYHQKLSLLPTTTIQCNNLKAK